MHNNLLLQNYVFIPLDIFKANLHNKDINSKLDAWLTFLCMDEPEWIIKVIEAYPQFKAMYRQVYEMCLNVERVMTMFSSELRELDRNTVHYMIDEMQNEINRMGSQIQQKDNQIRQQDEELQQSKSKIRQKDEELQQSKAQIQQLMKRISELEGK